MLLLLRMIQSPHGYFYSLISIESIAQPPTGLVATYIRIHIHTCIPL